MMSSSSTTFSLTQRYLILKYFLHFSNQCLDFTSDPNDPSPGEWTHHSFHRIPVCGVAKRRERAKGREWFLQSVAVRCGGAAVPPGGARPCAGCSLAEPLRAAGNCPRAPEEGAEKNKSCESLNFLEMLVTPVSPLAGLPRLHETTRQGGF